MVPYLFIESQHYDVTPISSSTLLFSRKSEGSVQLTIIDDKEINEDRDVFLTMTPGPFPAGQFNITVPETRVVIVDNDGRPCYRLIVYRYSWEEGLVC
jgi:hypothetical protein